jgi:hypothetical protein
MFYSRKFVVTAFVLTLGLTGTAQAASEDFLKSDSEQLKTIEGDVQKVEGELYTITDKEGKEIRLRIEDAVLQGKKPQEGDTIHAKVLMGSIMYNVISAKKAGQGTSMQSQSPSAKDQPGETSHMQGQQAEHSGAMDQSGNFTKTIQGTVQKVDGNIYTVQTDQGEKVRLRLDQSTQQEGDIKEGDTIEALVTQDKEFHVISAQAAQEQ